ALNLSGDFYDYIPLSPDRVGILIGDVAGKGVRAAMGMAAARSILRSVARRGGGPSRVLRDANLRLHRDPGRGLLPTLPHPPALSRARPPRQREAANFSHRGPTPAAAGQGFRQMEGPENGRAAPRSLRQAAIQGRDLAPGKRRRALLLHRRIDRGAHAATQ